ncbi:MAG: aldehyde dehydrogenase family protein, partial [Clostridiaceae bacterium]|nr:aldehyde dehydrogenase family protein [Clostridiaceae bacterium]
LVKASYSSGKPAFGVGPGNVPAFIERSADIDRAVADIISSKTFDNGTICASKQAVITENVIADAVMQAFRSRSCYFLQGDELDRVSATVMQSWGGVNPAVVGKSAVEVARMANVDVPEDTKILIAQLEGVGRSFPLSAEKLCPVLAFYLEEDWQSACERCFELLRFGGLGHSMAIHSNNREIIMEFAMKKPVFRILVNTPSSQGAIGLTTNLQPSMTLGCGSWGENVTSDNVGPQHLINTKRLAFSKASLETRRYTMKEIEETVSRYLSRVNSQE